MENTLVENALVENVSIENTLTVEYEASVYE